MDETETAPFIMYGARDAIANGLTCIEQKVKSIEKAIVENPGLTFDFAKTLVESVCRAVLVERKVTFTKKDDLPKLFKIVSNHLPLLPRTASGETEMGNSLKRTLGGLSTTIQGICELRNRCGFASHGSGDVRPAMESVQARLAAQAADTIVGFLYRVHCQNRTPLPSRQALYEDNPTFNEFVDEAYGMIRIFESEFRPSDILFQMEPEGYRVYLGEFNPDAEAEAESVEADVAPRGPAEVAT